MKKRKKSASKRRPSALRSSRVPGAKMEALETRAMMASDLNAWHNANMANDINGDSIVDDVDLQIMISQIQLGPQNYTASSQAAGGLEGEQVLYLDVNNDGAFNPLDLNAMLSSMLEGEDADTSFSAAFKFEIYQNGNLMPLATADSGFDVNNMPDSTPVAVQVQQSTFTLKVYVRNTSALTGHPFDPMGGHYPDILGAYLDINYDPTIVQPVDAGMVPPSGPPYDSDHSPFSTGGGPPTTINPSGIIEQAGGDSTVINSSLSGYGWEEDQLLYSIDFTPTQAGMFTLFGSKAEAYEVGVPDINRAAVLFIDATGTVDNATDQPLDIINLAFPSFNIEVLPVAGANNDLVEVSADLVKETAANDPRIVDINGDKYLAIDVKANDKTFANTNLTDGSEVILSLESGYADTSLTVAPPLLQDRVMVSDQSTYPIAGFKDQYLLYLLPPDLSGTEVIKYTLTDASDPMKSNAAKVTVIITPEVVAVDDGDAMTPFATVEVNETQNLDVLANDFVAGDGQVVSTDHMIITAIADDSGTAVTDGRVVIAADMKSIDFTASAVPGLETFTYTVTYVDDMGMPKLDSDGLEITDTATVTVRVPIHSLITGQLYFDVNNNQSWDDNAANNASPEQFIGGVQVTLYQGGVIVGSAFSSEADGTFKFAGIDAGTYSVKITQPKFVYKYGTAMSTPLPAGWTVLSDGSVMINNLTISANSLTIGGLNLGYVGRTGPYRGITDQIANVGETSITFAVSKQADGSGKLEWYSPDQGWNELVAIDGFLFNSATKTGQFIMHVDPDNDPMTDNSVIAPITFSPSNPYFLLIADTSDAVIFMLTGDIREIVDHLSNVDIAFTDI